jgi:Fic family protein
MNRFEQFYNPENLVNKSKIRRIISIAASHHRLAWIHPFLDGNGRVVRLFSDALFMIDRLDAGGLWSISRGLARNKEDYRAHLAQADEVIINDYDDRGNLSDKKLFDFCDFFLKTAIDQADFMFNLIDVSTMLNRISRFSQIMTMKNKLKPEAEFILTDVFLKGKITKSEAMRITNTSDKTVKLLIEKLIDMRLIEAKKEGIHMMYYVNYPIEYAAYFFPGIYPASKESDLMS